MAQVLYCLAHNLVIGQNNCPKLVTFQKNVNRIAISPLTWALVEITQAYIRKTRRTPMLQTRTDNKTAVGEHSP